MLSILYVLSNFIMPYLYGNILNYMRLESNFQTKLEEVQVSNHEFSIQNYHLLEEAGQKASVKRTDCQNIFQTLHLPHYIQNIYHNFSYVAIKSQFFVSVGI